MVNRLMALLLVLLMAAPVYAQDTSNGMTKTQIQSQSFVLNGGWDFDNGRLRHDRGVCPPPSTFCDNANDIGSIFVCTDTAALYSCRAVGVAEEIAGSGGGECSDDRVFCVGPDQEYTQICGMTSDTGTAGTGRCGNATDTCKSGTALFDAKASGLCTITQPCVIKIAAGSYDECVHVEGVTDLSFIGAGIDKTLIHPIISSSNDVQNGAFRFGATGSAYNAARILVSDMTIWNDAYSAPEAGAQLGFDSGPGAGNVSTWQDIKFVRTKIIGHHDCFQVFGDDVTAANQILPRFEFIDSVCVGGRDNIVWKGCNDGLVQNNTLWTRPTYCTDPNTAAGSTGAIVSATTTAWTLANSEPLTTNYYANRKIVLSENGGGCPNTCEGVPRWIKFYSPSSNRVATVDVAITSCTPNTGCNYTISAEADVANSPCLAPVAAPDWDTLVLTTGNGGLWKIGGGHSGTGSQICPVGRGGIRFLNNSVRIDVSGASPFLASAPTQWWIYGGLLYTATPQRALFQANTVDINILTDTASNKANYIAGFIVDGANGTEDALVTGNTIRINNSDPNGNAVDLDSNVSCIIYAGTGTPMVESGNTCELNMGTGYTGQARELVELAGTGLTHGDLQCKGPCDTVGAFALMGGTDVSDTGTLDFGSITSTCIETVNGGGAATIAIPGAADGDSCSIAPANAVVSTVKSSFTCRVSAAGVVTVQHCCNNGTCDPNSGSFTATVRHK